MKNLVAESLLMCLKLEKQQQIILKNKQMLREQYENFHDKTKKSSRPGKYKVVSDILYKWYQKCCSSNFYPYGPLLKEETMEIKNQLQNSDLDCFVASDKWLEKWEATYAIKEKRIIGEGGMCQRKLCRLELNDYKN